MPDKQQSHFRFQLTTTPTFEKCLSVFVTAPPQDRKIALCLRSSYCKYLVKRCWQFFTCHRVIVLQKIFFKKMYRVLCWHCFSQRPHEGATS